MNFLKTFLVSQTFWKYPSSRATLLRKTTKISWNLYYLSYFWQWAVKFAARPCCNITTFSDRNLCWEKIYILYACVMWPFKTFFPVFLTACYTDLQRHKIFKSIVMCSECYEKKLSIHWGKTGSLEPIESWNWDNYLINSLQWVDYCQKKKVLTYITTVFGGSIMLNIRSN